VPDYSQETGLPLQWDAGFEVSVSTDEGGAVSIRANAAGLRSLARCLLTLADESVPPGTHVHLDASNAFEQGSIELIVERA
jgi:hypothetical protein